MSSERKDGSYLAACPVDDYGSQLKDKVDSFRNGLLDVQRECLPQIEEFESPKQHFRMRANFQMWHDDGKNKTPEGFFYAMFDEKDPKTPCEVKTFPRGTQRINDLMPQILQACHSTPVIFKHLFEVRFLTTKSDEALVVLLYKQPLHSTWHAAAEELAAKLDVKIIGRARKMKQVAGVSSYNSRHGSNSSSGGDANSSNDDEDETICETLYVGGRSIRLFQTEGAFSQPNAFVCEKMISWALDVTSNSHEHDLLELYCGGGTFTVPLSFNFRKVLATEISKASVDLAKRAFRANGITNIQMLRFSSEEFTEFYEGKSYRRAQASGVALSDYAIKTVFVDPPRAGLDPGTTKLVSGFANIVYISCNPVTLVRDLKELCKTHEIRRLAAFDQFPYTHHLECGVYLVRRESELPAAVAEASPDATSGADEVAEERDSKKPRVA